MISLSFEVVGHFSFIKVCLAVLNSDVFFFMEVFSRNFASRFPKNRSSLLKIRCAKCSIMLESRRLDQKCIYK